VSLAAGTRIGGYEVVDAIGSGGMGDVYRARDTRLKRDVAIKILPAAFAGDADRRTRFEREATVLASLNHPGIAHLYGIEDTANGTALVMELVDGEDLSDCIGRGLPLSQVSSIARQLSEALAAAHDRGIIHRDLKPANIKLGPDGTIKILDFGLAKSQAADDGAATVTRAGLTEAGMVMGTAGYMSPEQAAGRDVDARTDVWAFGCVLFEMCSGARPFAGQTSLELIASVIKDEPAWNKLEGTPAPLRSLIKRCLQKDVQHRLRHIADARAWLDDGFGEASAAAPRRSRGRAIAFVTLAVVAAVAAGVPTWLLLRREAVPPPETIRFRIEIPESQRFIITPAGNTMTIAPDSRTVVYQAIVGDSFQLLRRPLDAVEATPIAGTERAQNFAFSPDGTQIAFYNRGAIRTVPVTGGSPITVCDVEGLSPFITWADPGHIWFLGDRALKRCAVTGGTPETVVEPDASRGEGNFFALGNFPGGAVVTYVMPPPGGNHRGRIAVLPPGGTVFKTLLEEANSGQYANGHLWYVQARELRMAPFDLSRLEFTGEARVVGPAPGTWLMAPDGTRVTVRGGGGGSLPTMRLAWLTPSGQPAGVVADNLPLARHPRISRDGEHLSVIVGTGNGGSAWRYSLRSGAQPVRVTFARQGGVHYAIWRPAGDALTYLEAGGRFGLFSTVADGATIEPTAALVSRYDAIPEDWTPDGTTLIYQAVSAATGVDLRLHNLRTGEDTAWQDTPFNEAEARISPDGRWVAYVSDQTGRHEVWLRPFAGGSPVRISGDGGHEPRWSGDGKVIFFHSGARMMASDITLAPEARASTPRVLFEGGFIPYNTSFRRTYDVAPDGRFLVVQRASEPPQWSLEVVVNPPLDVR
jgi:hypothetical protein